MPNYDYVCERCGPYELRQNMSDEPHKICQRGGGKCGAPCRRKIGAGTGVIFKGSGFYETDYKQKKVAKREADQD